MAAKQTHWVLTTAPAWVPDGDVTACKVCNNEFTFFKRKHHCRNCGNVVCADCSQKRIRLPQYGITTEERVCDSCFPGGGKTSLPPFPVD